MAFPEHDRTRVFISYSHEDAEWSERLRRHLKALELDYAIDIWDDTKIRPGSKWQQEIKNVLRSAKVAVLLISADFLASEFIRNNELPPLLDAANKEGVIILPVIVSPCRFAHTRSLSMFQAVNSPSDTLIEMTVGEQEKLFVKVTEEIEAALSQTLHRTKYNGPPGERMSAHEIAVKQSLESWKYNKYTFAQINRKFGGFEDDELRQILVGAGAERFKRRKDGAEMWGLTSRNKPRSRPQAASTQ